LYPLRRYKIADRCSHPNFKHDHEAKLRHAARITNVGFQA
jgi:hypothetical protein